MSPLTTAIVLTPAAPATNPFPVYQGQEQHFTGGETPANREPVWGAKYDKEAPLYVLASTLNKVRDHAVKLSADYVSTHSETLWADVNHLCLKKGPDGSQIVFCINNKSSKGDSYESSIGGFQANDKVVELLGCTVDTADASGNVTMYMGRGEPKVYVTEAMLKGSGLCNDTTEAAAIPPGSGAAALGVTGSMLLAGIIGWAMVLFA